MGGNLDASALSHDRLKSPQKAPLGRIQGVMKSDTVDLLAVMKGLVSHLKYFSYKLRVVRD